MRALVRQSIAILELVLRDRWGHARERGFWALAVPAAVALGLLLVFVPLGVTAAAILSGLDGDPRHGVAVEALVTSIFLGWVATGVLAGARYTWQLDLTRILRLPLGFRTAWAVRAAVSLWGPWLVVFAPVLVACAWTGSPGWGTALWRTALVVVFASITSELTVALRWRYAWLAARRQSFWVALAVGWLVVTPLLVLVVRGPEAGGRIAAWVIEQLPSSTALSWLAPGALARGLVTRDAGDLVVATMVLVGTLGAVLCWSYRTCRRALLVEPPLAVPATRAAGSMLAFVTQPGAMMPASLRVHAALMAIELLNLLRIPNLRLLLAFGVPYFGVFPLLLPLGDSGPAAAVMLMAVVFLFCSSLKSNVLGIDAATVRQYFTWPVSPAAAVRVRLTVLNLAIGLMCAEVVAVVALKGGIRSIVDLVVVGSTFTSLLLATDAVGGRWSVRSPVSVSWGRAFPVANDAGSLVLGGVILAVTLVYAGLLAVLSRFALTAPVLLAALALPLIIAGWPWRQFRRWSAAALSHDRERLFAKLEV